MLPSTDWRDVPQWPARWRYGLLAATAGLLLGLGYLTLIRPVQKETADQRVAIDKLKKDIEAAQQVAAALPAYQAQDAALQARIKLAEGFLPDRQEIAGFLTSITRQGRAAGLEFTEFSPQPERYSGRVAEIPVKLIVNGDTASVGQFLAILANMDRLVRLQALTIERADKPGLYPLKLTGELLTYRYLEEQEYAARQKAARKQKKPA